MKDLYDYTASNNNRSLLSAIKDTLSNYACVFLCVGSDKVTGDCLGPLTGQLLTKDYNVNAYIYGTLEKPITAQNLVFAESFIRKKHRNCKIVTIDASLGNLQDVGNIKILNSGLMPGLALNQTLPVVGDFSITATVNFGNSSNSSLLFSTSLCVVYRLAQTIAYAVSEFINEKNTR